MCYDMMRCISSPSWSCRRSEADEEGMQRKLEEVQLAAKVGSVTSLAPLCTACRQWHAVRACLTRVEMGAGCMTASIYSWPRTICAGCWSQWLMLGPPKASGRLL